MQTKSTNPKLEQPEIPKDLKKSSSKLQRYRKEKNILSPYRIPPSSNTTHTRRQKSPSINLDDVEIDLKWSQDDLKWPQNKLKRTG